MGKSDPGKIRHREGPRHSLGRQFPSEGAVRGSWVLRCRFGSLHWVCCYSGLACCSGGSSQQSFGPACLQSLPGFQSAGEDPALLTDMPGGSGLFIYMAKRALEDVPVELCGGAAKVSERMLECGKGSDRENWPGAAFCLRIVLLDPVPRVIRFLGAGLLSWMGPQGCI